MSNPSRFSVDLMVRNEKRRVELVVDQAIVAGWTTRNKEDLERHIAELEKLGVARPPSAPIFYSVSATRVTTATSIQAPGEATTGEVEFILAKIDGQLCVGVGSDHTDRDSQAYKVSVSKQMCDKPIAPTFWLYAEVHDHWDELILRSHATIDGERVLYQEGPVSTILSPENLLGKLEQSGQAFGDGKIMFCGTHSAIGGVRPAARFDFELIDPKLNRSITHGYDIDVLPMAD